MNPSDFPDSDDEFDFDVSSSTVSNKQTTNNVSINWKSSVESRNKTTLQNSDFPDSDDEFNMTPLITTQNTTPIIQPIIQNKRNYNDIIGDDNFDFDNDDDDFDQHRNKKLCWDKPDEVLKAIKAMKYDKIKKPDANKKLLDNKKNKNISLSVPSWNFIALTRESDAQRIYIRLKQDSNNQSINKPIKPIGGLLLVNYETLKMEAEKIIINNVKKASIVEKLTSTVATKKSKYNDQLWVDKYRPKSYVELLSEEAVNCALLYWIKLWDKVVFNSDIKMNKKRIESAMYHINSGGGGFNKYKKIDNKEEAELVDKKNFPIQRIALLTGPPGLGKTTLAHLVAHQAGYNVVDINASNDRNPESFRQVLLSSTQMKPLIGTNDSIGRPNCLIFDEIDGAPTTSIDLLIQFVQGKLTTKGNNNKKQKTTKDNEYCKRPVICICNELYTPSLRALRTMAFIINVPKINPSLLADRLQTISRYENIKVDKSILKDLADKSGCDIRSCLGALQYMGNDVTKDNISLGTKDTKIGLFDAWRNILQIPSKKLGNLTPFDKVQRVLRIARDDNSERFAMGIFENYPLNCIDDINLIVDAIDWFTFYDEITTIIREKQDWRVMSYANYSFVAWHLSFSTLKNPKLNFPYVTSEANQLLNNNKNILEIAKRHCGIDGRVLLLDVAPFLSELLTPKLRALAGHLLSPKEKAELQRLVDVMLDYGLTFVPDRNQEDGTIDFVLEPNLIALGTFPDCKIRRGLPYAVKQIVLRELEYGKVNRQANIGKNKNNDEGKNIAVRKTHDNNDIIDVKKTFRPIHLKDMETIIVPVKKKLMGDVFDNFLRKPPTKPAATTTTTDTSPLKKKLDVKYRSFIKTHGVYYKYKEGFSNAIRRNIKIDDIL
ncbi:hypothetical protein HCN44_004912 [Aphidius gifuensis]|uniref:AAA+ ATPase domain-containing protein n=1 Tax=Aphidius gifuensis TaxID=684658 RepID=A0A835CSS8_APHGI|nr:hypothetical protein HCN44_004912 [Aphidius gifuensis]